MKKKEKLTYIVQIELEFANMYQVEMGKEMFNTLVNVFNQHFLTRNKNNKFNTTIIKDLENTYYEK